jgi:hypothetical protein
VDGVEERARLLLCLFEQGRKRGDVGVGLAVPDGDAGDDRDL